MEGNVAVKNMLSKEEQCGETAYRIIDIFLNAEASEGERLVLVACLDRFRQEFWWRL